MAYEGYLFQFGEFIFPNEHIKFDSYDIAPDQRQDMDSFTNGKGITVRNALEHTKTNITFSTLPMSGSEMGSIMSNMTKNYKNVNETDADCVYFNPRTYRYSTGHFYLDPSIKFRIKKADKDGAEINYGEMQWTFIEY